MGKVLSVLPSDKVRICQTYSAVSPTIRQSVSVRLTVLLSLPSDKVRICQTYSAVSPTIKVRICQTYRVTLGESYHCTCIASLTQMDMELLFFFHASTKQENKSNKNV